MASDFEQTAEAAEFIRSRVDATPQLALILGSGLGVYADTLDNATAIPYEEIPHFPTSTVKGHAGQLVVGTVHGASVVAMQGRVHGYEGLPPQRLVFPLRTMWQLGARTLLVTNAAGCCNPNFHPGDLMLIRDHINLSGLYPLTGENDDRYGPRFPDVSEAYSRRLRHLARTVARSRGIAVREGVYVCNMGPAYETPAEVRMAHVLGGDAVGMSTVPEVVAARHLGMDVVGLSCITNMGAGLGSEPLHHDEVTEVARLVRERFIELVDGIIGAIAAEGQDE